MLRSLVLGVVIPAATAAAGQTAPLYPASQPAQPTQPGSTQTFTDPNAFPASPPSFAPGLGGSDLAESTPRPRAIRISSGVMAGNLLTKTDPVSPAAARDVQGTVVMSAHIGKNGHVASLAVVSGPQALQAAALNAVKQWTYRPYLLNGEPIDVLTNIVVNFNRR